MNISAGRIKYLLAALILLYAFGCDGKKYGLEQNILDYQDVDMVTFTLSGRAICEKCEEDELPIEALEIQVFHKDDPLNNLAIKITGGLGSFSIPNIRAASGRILEIHGTIYREGTTGFVTAYYGYTEVVAPDDDGDVVSCIINFPSSEYEEDEE